MSSQNKTDLRRCKLAPWRGIAFEIQVPRRTWSIGARFAELLSPMRPNFAKAMLMSGCEPHSRSCKTKISAKKSVQRWQCPVSGTGKLLADAGDGRRAIGDHTEPIRRSQDVALARLGCVMPPGLVPDNIRRLRRCACGSGQGLDSGDLTA